MGSKGLGRVEEDPGSRPEPLGGLWYWSQRACSTDLVDTYVVSPSALPSFPHNDTREQVLPAGQIVSKYPEVIGTHRTKLCTDSQLLS